MSESIHTAVTTKIQLSCMLRVVKIGRYSISVRFIFLFHLENKYFFCLKASHIVFSVDNFGANKKINTNEYTHGAHLVIVHPTKEIYDNITCDN